MWVSFPMDCLVSSNSWRSLYKHPTTTDPEQTKQSLSLKYNLIFPPHRSKRKEKKRKTRTHDSLLIAHNICQLYNKWGYSKIQPNIFFEHRNVSRILRSKLFIWPPKTSILPSQLLLYAGHCIITTFIILPQILLPDFTGIFQSSCLFLVIFLLLPDFNKIFQSRCPFLVIFLLLET